MAKPENASQPAADELKIEWLAIDQLAPYQRNARTHSDEQIEQIKRSMLEFGWTNNPVGIRGETIGAGHGRIAAARALWAEGKSIRGCPRPGFVPTVRLDHLTDAQFKAWVIADNKIALNAGWDLDTLKLELGDLDGAGFDLGLTGFSAEELGDIWLAGDESEGDDSGGRGKATGNLADRFGVPPFTVLNAREGWWQERKRAWIALGIRSELGRGEGSVAGAANAIPGGAKMPLDRVRP